MKKMSIVLPGLMLFALLPVAAEEPPTAADVVALVEKAYAKVETLSCDAKMEVVGSGEDGQKASFLYKSGRFKLTTIMREGAMGRVLEVLGYDGETLWKHLDMDMGGLQRKESKELEHEKPYCETEPLMFDLLEAVRGGTLGTLLSKAKVGEARFGDVSATTLTFSYQHPASKDLLLEPVLYIDGEKGNILGYRWKIEDAFGSMERLVTFESVVLGPTLEDAVFAMPKGDDD